jgi:hypothetical protein
MKKLVVIIFSMLSIGIYAQHDSTDFYAGYKAYFDRYVNALGSNLRTAASLQPNIIKLANYMELYRGYTCVGDVDNAAIIRDDILDILASTYTPDTLPNCSGTTGGTGGTTQASGSDNYVQFNLLDAFSSDEGFKYYPNSDSLVVDEWIKTAEAILDTLHIEATIKVYESGGNLYINSRLQNSDGGYLIKEYGNDVTPMYSSVADTNSGIGIEVDTVNIIANGTTKLRVTTDSIIALKPLRPNGIKFSGDTYTITSFSNDTNSISTTKVLSAKAVRDMINNYGIESVLDASGTPVHGQISLWNDANTLLGKDSIAWMDGGIYFNGKSQNITIGTKTTNNGNGNINIGIGIGFGMISGATENVNIGGYTSEDLTTGDHNVNVGVLAGNNISTGSGHTNIGTTAGSRTSTQDSSVNIGANTGGYGSKQVNIGTDAGAGSTTNSTLYIENTTANKFNALIWGDFANDSLRLNATVKVKTDIEIRDTSIIDLIEAHSIASFEGAVISGTPVNKQNAIFLNDSTIRASDTTYFRGGRTYITSQTIATNPFLFFGVPDTGSIAMSFNPVESTIFDYNNTSEIKFNVNYVQLDVGTNPFYVYGDSVKSSTRISVPEIYFPSLASIDTCLLMLVNGVSDTVSLYPAGWVIKTNLPKTFKEFMSDTLNGEQVWPRMENGKINWNYRKINPFSMIQQFQAAIEINRVYMLQLWNEKEVLEQKNKKLEEKIELIEMKYDNQQELINFILKNKKN